MKKLATWPTSVIASYLASFSGLPKQCRYGIILNLVECSLSGVCFFLSLYFVKDLHYSVDIAGVMLSVYAVGTAFGGFIGGKLSDHFSPRLIVSASLLLESVAFLALVQAKSLYPLLAILFVLGFGLYGFLTANNTWVIQYCFRNKHARLKAINLLYTASNCGFGIASLIIIAIAPQGFQYVFIICFITLLAASIMTLLKRNISARNTGDSQELQEEVQPEDKTTLKKTPADKKVILFVLICTFIAALLVAQRSTVYLIYVHDLFPASGMLGVALVFVLNPLLIVLFQAPLVRYFRSANKVFMVGVGIFLMGIGMCMLNISITFSLVIIACVVYTIGEMLFFSMAQFVCYEKGGEKKKGRSFGNFKTVYAMGIIAGPVLSGLVYHHISGSTLWYIDGVLALLAIVSCSYLKQYD